MNKHNVKKNGDWLSGLNFEILLDNYKNRIDELKNWKNRVILSNQVDLIRNNKKWNDEEGTLYIDPLFLMPNTAGITNYFDSNKGLTANKWKNQIANTGDISWIGMTIQSDGSAGITCQQASHGYFDLATSESFQAIYGGILYIICKSPLLNEKRIIIGTDHRQDFPSTGGYNEDTAIAYSDSSKIMGIWGGRDSFSDITSEDYHIIVAEKRYYQSGAYRNAYDELYIDGVGPIDIKDFSRDGFGKKIGVGCLMSNTGEKEFLNFSGNALLQIKFIAAGTAQHTIDEIQENVDWLRNYYNL